MTYVIYDLIVSVVAAVYYCISGLRRGEWKTRMEWYAARTHPQVIPVASEGKDLIWIHGVSAGEARAAGKLAAAFRRLSVDAKIVISSSTPSGYAKAAGAAESDAAIVMPIDHSELLVKLFSQLRPTVLIIIESEFWPQLFHVARKEGVPVIVANASMTDKSYLNLKRFAWLRRATVLMVEHFYVQHSLTMSRLVEIGVAPERITVSGNIKLSPPMPEAVLHAQSLLPPAADPRTRSVSLGNLRPEECEGASGVVQLLRAEFKDLRVMIVPRHPSKFTADEIYKIFGEDIKIVHSLSEVLPSDRLIWFATMGILEAVYASSDVAVVFGTFGDIGGHDIVEPMHFGAVTFYGPNVRKQRALHAAISSRMPWAQVDSFTALSKSIGDLLGSETALHAHKSEVQIAVRQFSSVTEELARTIATSRNLKSLLR